MLTVTNSLAIAATRDPGSTRLVYGIVVALVLLGLGLAAFAWWLSRATRPDRELLAPLEAIQSRRWRRLDPAGRRRLLDDLRPEGAEPQHPAPDEPARDTEFGDTPEIRDVRELAAVDDGRPALPAPDPSTSVVGVAEAGPTTSGAASDGQHDWDHWDAELGLGTPRALDGDSGGESGDTGPDDVSVTGTETASETDSEAVEDVEIISGEDRHQG